MKNIEAIREYVKLEEITDLLKKIIRIPSVASRETDVANIITDVLEKEGITSYEIIESAPGRGNLIIDIKGKLGDGYNLMIVGHSDVVPIESKWTVDPFGGVEKDGFIYGRGAIDDKGQVAVMTYLAILLHRMGYSFKGSIRLLIAADEEVQDPHHGVRFLVKHRPDIFKGVDGAIGELGGLIKFMGEERQIIAFGEKGSYIYRIKFFGEKGHSSMPYGIINPIEVAMKFLKDLPTGVFYPSEPVKDMLRAVFGWRSFFIMNRFFNRIIIKRLVVTSKDIARFIHALTHIIFAKTVIRGGEADNVIPESAEVIIDVRCFPEHDEEFLRKLILQFIPKGCKYRIEVKAGTPSTYSDLNTPLYNAIVKTIHDLGFKPLPLFQVGTSDSAWIRPLGIPVYHFITTRKEIELERIHGTDERIWKEDLMSMLEGYYLLIKNLQEVK